MNKPMFDELESLRAKIAELEAQTEPQRRRLPDERESVTHKFDIGGVEGYITVGFYPDTREPGEIFVRMAKEGSTLSGLLDSWAIMVSMALQYGVPLASVVKKFSHARFEPSGFTGTSLGYATSVPDYVVRWLASRFLSEDEARTTIPPEAGPPCPSCGEPQIRDGDTWCCPTCEGEKP